MEDFSGRLVRVYSTSSITDGYLARGRLEADGIPVIVKGEGEGPYRMGPVHLYVPEEVEVQARMILAEVGAGSASEGGPSGELDTTDLQAEPELPPD
ncbi:MAG: DUF2007 domain-containing protein [Actinobacteria bacterium]|nr:DUF2007 domain-containing protein [Actinomycetota bacterium]